MSKYVIIFLALFALLGGSALFLLKNSATPAPVSSTLASTADSKDTAKVAENKADHKNDVASADTAKNDASPAASDDSVAAKPAADDTAAKSDDATKPDDTAKSDETKPAPDAAPISDTAKANESLLAPSAATDIDMNNALAERTLGDKDAPVKIIEYASMTCPHCARFSNDVFAQVKSTFIDTGKVYFIYRDYPLDTTALKAAMMARCADRSKYFDLVEVIFKNQEHWIKSNDPIAGLKQLGALAGMDEATINSCMNNAELQNELLRRMQEGQNKFKVNATPTFVFNDGADYISGDQSLEDFQKVIDKLPKKGN